MRLDLIVIPHSHETGIQATRQYLHDPGRRSTYHYLRRDRARFYVLQDSVFPYRTSEKKMPAMHIAAKTAIEIFIPSMNAG
jgi:1,2-phenylacetyl-CoA epoxidase PaaB subunit